MDIFIDESGSFVIPDIPKKRVNTVTSLIIPSKFSDEVTSKFLSLRGGWESRGEVKGSQLKEKQISDVINLLRNYQVIVEIVCLDIGLHTNKGVSEFKDIQAGKILENITEHHQATMVVELQALHDRLIALPNQLFLQAMASILLIERILKNGTIYYSQTMPKELGSFIWSIDAKNSSAGKTNFEELWATLLMPFLESNFSLPQLPKGDYTYFSSFEVEIEDMTEHQKKSQTERSSGGVDIKAMISKNISFNDSSSSEGLQLVDIISSAFSRAMNGTLGIKGWRHLGALMVQEPQMVVFDTDENVDLGMDSRHQAVLETIRQKGRPILV